MIARLLFLLMFLPAFALAQSQTAATAPTTDTEGIARVDKTVSVLQTPTDPQIAKRITRILQVTGWFQDLQVDATEGVVRLRGTVSKKSQSEWAENLATDTDGVIAVVNDLNVRAGKWFDLNPAKVETENLAKSITAFFPYLLAALLVLGIFLFFASIANRIGRRAAQRRVSNPLLVEIVAKLFALPVMIIGLYLVLRMSGLTGMAVTIMGGTGAVGLIVGFALKNILENYFSGIMLSVRNPFKIGDTVDINGKVGVVQKLTTRGTILVDFDGNHIIIPNSTIYGGVITNQSANPSTRIKFSLYIGYGEDIKAAREIIASSLASLPEVLPTPEPLAMVDEFNVNGVRMTIYFWIDAVKSSTTKTQSKAMELIKINLQKAHIEFPGAQRYALTRERILRDKRHFDEAADRAGRKPEQTLDASGDTTAEAPSLLKEAKSGRDIDHGDDLI